MAEEGALMVCWVVAGRTKRLAASMQHTTLGIEFATIVARGLFFHSMCGLDALPYGWVV